VVARLELKTKRTLLGPLLVANEMGLTVVVVVVVVLVVVLGTVTVVMGVVVSGTASDTVVGNRRTLLVTASESVKEVYLGTGS